MKPSIPIHANRNTLWSAVLVAELQRAGLAQVVIAPGSRSAPLALAFGAQPGLQVFVHPDERGAAFFALGLALASGKPAAVLCTSGTAAANFFPAVVEAHQSNIPLLVLTADRPPELRESGSNQTIDQVKLFGGYTRWSVEAPLPEANPSDLTLQALRSLAGRALAATQGLPPGPVHLNLPFRKPLEPTPVPGDVPERFQDPAWLTESVPSIPGQPYVQFSRGKVAPDPAQVESLTQAVRRAGRGIIFCGPRCPGGDFPSAVYRLAQATGFPIFADALSGVRFHPSLPAGIVLGGYETFLKSPALGSLEPAGLVLQFGAVPTSTALGDYLRGLSNVERIQISGQSAWSDDTFNTTSFIWADPQVAIEALLEQLAPSVAQGPNFGQNLEHSLPNKAWYSALVRAERLAWQAFDQARLESPFEGALLADILEILEPGDSLFVANSLPVRHLDQFGRPAADHRPVYANRGASGIDGTLASAAGVAAQTGGRLLLVAGDLAFFHDLNSLLLLHKYRLKVTIVLINNDGGGIFQRLPVSGYEPLFSSLFRAPHGLTFEPAARLFQLGYKSLRMEQAGHGAFRLALARALASERPNIVEVFSDVTTNEAARKRIIQTFTNLWESTQAS
jgi:2-succinyl-5-enolpyruvyl-6-hydroxy-3-cyclohexene-1-carboxylate synthase